MTVINSLQKLVQMFLRGIFAKSTGGRLQFVQQRVVQVFKYQVEPPLATEHFNHIN